MTRTAARRRRILSEDTTSSFGFPAPVATPMGEPTLTTVETGRLLPSDGDYAYVPFQVPPGTSEVYVSCEYDEGCGTTLNVGVFSPAGHDLGNGRGFRGWSHGGAPGRRTFMLSGRLASPGYLPGDLPPGTWHAALNAHTVPASGLMWRLLVTVRLGRVQREQPPSFAPESVNETAGWYRGDLHLHTVHSDGQYTPEEIVIGALRSGLDFVISTDHNTTSAHRVWGEHSRGDLLILNGEEVTTPAGHWGACGLSPGHWVDFRYRPGDALLARFVAEVRADGGVAIANHPEARSSRGCCWEFDLAEMDCVEVWNGPWSDENEQALADWDALLRRGSAVAAVGASDAHRPGQRVGHPQTVVSASGLNRRDIVSALQGGRAYVAESRRLSLDLTVASGGRRAGLGEALACDGDEPLTASLQVTGPERALSARLIGSRGTVHGSPVVDGRMVVGGIDPAATDYLRVEVRRSDGTMVALTNPIRVHRTSSPPRPRW